MSCHYSRTAQPRALIATLASLPLFTSSAWAAPLSSLAKRDSSGGGNKIIAPIIVVVVFVIIVPMLFYRKSLFSKLRNITFYSVLAPHQPPVTVRDLTAEEIAGTTATTQAQTAATARTERRGRRNRRTPSQISTRSLPAYMKEPGELELVIIQGSQDMEDAPLTTQVLMPSVREDEDDESSQTHSRNISQASSYVIVNDDDSHAHTPLLEIDPSNEATHELENFNAHVSPGTVDISDVRDSDDLTPLPNSPELTDPRGEAPPYFEVVGDLEAVRVTSGELTRVETTDTLPMAPDTSRMSHEQSVETTMDDASAIPGTRRRSMFRGLIHAASRALSSPHTHPQSPTASRLSRDVPTSPRPSNMSTRPAGTRSQVGHRTTPSNGSVLSVTSSAFGRVTSRSRSTSNIAALTSPSMISITSISAPLTHTAVRTDFVYPRSGPTPEQLKLISSVDSVSKFGVPYGPAAVAYASASRVNLQPPPDFEERPSLDGLPGTSEATTRARSRSALSRRSQEGNPPDSRSPGSSPSPVPPAESTTAPQPTSTPASEPAISTSSPDHDTSDDTKEPELVDPVEIAPPRPPSPSPTVATTSTAATVTKATLSTLGAVAETPEDLVATSSHRPALPSFDAAAPPTARKPVAPSSFRMPPTPLGGMRAGSRTSSVETFRTAASSPEQGQRGGDENVMSDTELETDAFTDAEGGAETESETPPATPHAGPVVVGGIALGPEPHALVV
ncbi:hypothetical protein EDB89DRAFT_1985410 [Lactarius sanguifluus]|nr:hypothetical protein EDB89DRAFT_1985410 [Lactarius sanguifluus]